MIYLEMYGRLGNQLFRYAAARSLQLNYYPEEKLIINFNQVYKLSDHDSSFDNYLKHFNVVSYEEYRKRGKVIFNESFLSQKVVSIPYYLKLRKIRPEEMNKLVNVEKEWHKKLQAKGVYWFRKGEYGFAKSEAKNKFLSGPFENPIYFDNIRSVLLKEFKPKYKLLDKNNKLLETIQNTNSICVSVRRGDYENNSNITRLHSVCNKQYFERAIEIMKKRIDNPVFFMFSDDINWVRENINTDCTTYYEDGTDPVWEKLRLMSNCKHFIISNSTFSWWAQYLSEYEDKTVISPDRWYNNDYKSPLINKEWIQVPV